MRPFRSSLTRHQSSARARARLLLAALALALPAGAGAQARAGGHAEHGAATSAHVAALHLEMSPVRPRSAADSARAAAVVATLRSSIARYRDTLAAVTDGYRMFAPQIRQQRVYHFTNRWNALQESFRFDPARPTSLLYTRGADGRFNLIGAMYAAPRRFDADRLDERIPLSVARWHKHVNWCIPGRGETERWLERRDGQPVFGPESPIATESACDAVGGVFHKSPLGWMVHANVFAGDDPATIWGDEHAGHDMREAMKRELGP